MNSIRVKISDNEFKHILCLEGLKKVSLIPLASIVEAVCKSAVCQEWIVKDNLLRSEISWENS